MQVSQEHQKLLVNYRLKNRLSCSEMGGILGVCGSTISAWERGISGISRQRYKMLKDFLNQRAIMIDKQKTEVVQKPSQSMNYGWVCSRCGKSNAPSVERCDCPC